jgi:hypothetical protein
VVCELSIRQHRYDSLEYLTIPEYRIVVYGEDAGRCDVVLFKSNGVQAKGLKSSFRLCNGQQIRNIDLPERLECWPFEECSVRKLKKRTQVTGPVWFRNWRRMCVCHSE